MLRDIVSGKLLLAFDDVEEEAERVSGETLSRLSANAGRESDFGDLAESAFDAKITHYERLSDVRQGILNLIAVAIFHQFEQHQVTLVRRELLFGGSEDDPLQMTTKRFVELLAEADLDPTRFPQWPKLLELRRVANVAKHAEGRAASELEKIRPDLFVAPSIRDWPPFLHRKAPRRVYQPLSGDDLYVTAADLEAYFEAVLSFWEQLASMVRPA
jgi:hypothetical protein